MSLNSNLNQLKSMTVPLEGTKFQLKPVNVNDITSAYIKWLNDKEIMQHTEQQFRTTTLEDASDYVALMAQSKTDLFYGLFYEGTHIGSTTLGKLTLITTQRICHISLETNLFGVWVLQVK